MLDDRLALAAQRDWISSGRYCVFGARGDHQLSVFSAPQAVVTFFPDADLLHRRVETVRTPHGIFDGALVILPKSRRLGLDWLAQARGLTDQPILVDGQKTDGIEAILRKLRERAEVSVLTKAHGKILRVIGGKFADWAAQSEAHDGFMTHPGVFSADGIDPGSATLVEHLPAQMPGRGADLGAGWGYLSHATLARGADQVDLVEAEEIALDCARQNITDPRARFIWGDARNFQPDQPLDWVITNPPFHTGRKAQPNLGQDFIIAAARMLKPKGHLWLVANRHLPYEHHLESVFVNVSRLAITDGYKVFTATSPRRTRKKR